MKSTRPFTYLAIAVALFVLSCTSGESPTRDQNPGKALLGLNAVFPVDAGDLELATVSRIRVTILRFSNRAPLDTVVEDVDPAASEWVIEIEVDVPVDDPRVLLLVELISITGSVEAVEWAGITDPVTLDPGRVINVGQVAVLRGPADNLAVTSVTIIDPGPLLEGTGLQLTADVQSEQAGAQPVLHWASADPTVATITTDGFLQTLLPGIARISAVAGAHDDDIDVSVFPRAVGLSFNTNPHEVLVGVLLDPAPAVAIVDPRGSRVQTFNEPVTLTLQEVTGVGVSGEASAAQGASEALPDAASGALPVPGLVGPTTVAAVEGLARFPGLLVDGPGAFQLIASAVGLSPAGSAEFRVSLSETDIEVEKTVDRHVARSGEEVVFTVSVTNHGPAEALNVVVFDPLPAGLHFASADESVGGYDPVTGRWDVGTLTSGVQATLSLVATVEVGTAGTTIVNTARADVLIHQNDPPDNNEASAQVEVGTRQADIEVLKEADESSIHRGGEVVYTITVINHGPDEALGVVIDENVPTSLDVTGTEVEGGSFDPDGNQWHIPSMAPGEVIQLRVRTTLIDEVAVGDFVTNRAVAHTLEGQGDDPSNNEATSTIEVSEGGADLEVMKVADYSTAYVGDAVTYVITVKNRGPEVSTGAEVFELVPLGLDVPDGTMVVSQGTVEDAEGGGWAVGTLEPGESATMTLVGTVLPAVAGVTVVNSVVVVPGADEPDPVTSNNTAEHTLGIYSAVPAAAPGGGR